MTASVRAPPPRSNLRVISFRVFQAMKLCMRPSIAALSSRHATTPLRRVQPARSIVNDGQWSLDAAQLAQKYGLSQPAAFELVSKLNERLPSSQQLSAMLTKDDIKAAVKEAVTAELQVSRLEAKASLDSLRLEAKANLDSLRLEAKASLDSLRLELRIELLLVALIMAISTQPVSAAVIALFTKWVSK